MSSPVPTSTAQPRGPQREAAGPRARSSYLQRPHAAATLADHRAYYYDLCRLEGPLAEEIGAFLGISGGQVTIKQLRVAPCELPNAHRALRRALADWKYCGTTGPRDYQFTPIWAPIYRRVEVRPGRQRECLVEGSLFFELPDGRRRVIVVEEEYRRGNVEFSFSLIGPRREARELHAALQAVARSMRRRHYLRRQVIRGDGTLLRLGQRVAWDDLALDPAVRTTLEQNIACVLERGAAFRASRVPWRRGIMLYGPPGNGKTMIGKVLASLGRATFMWITPADFESRDYDLRDIFRLARKLRPTILFLEDLDFYAADRAYGAHGRLGELLAQMDGLERNDGLLIVATTNDLAAIEPALKDRPSRFDVRLEIGLPRFEARRQIIAQQLASLYCPVELVDRAAAASADLSGAQVRELAILTVQGAIFRGAIGPGDRAQPNDADLQAALTQLTGKSRQPLGFRAS